MPDCGNCNFCILLVKFTDVSLAMKIPFFPGHEIDFGILTIPILFVAVIGAVNGVNFTDGLDGLASSVTIMVATFFLCGCDWDKERH